MATLGAAVRPDSDDNAVGIIERFVSVKTLAQEWDCSKTTVSRLVERAGVPAYYFGNSRNGTKRYRRRDVDDYLHRIENAYPQIQACTSTPYGRHQDAGPHGSCK